MCSERRGLCCPHTTACLSSPPRRLRPRPWATASAPSTPMTPAGPRRGCPACLSCSCRRRSAASRPWPSPCLSAASAPGPRQTPWVYPTCLQTAPGSSRTSTNPRSPGWFPRRCRARPTWPARLSCVVPRTVTPGEGQASPRCAAKRWSTQYPWVSLRTFLSRVFSSSCSPLVRGEEPGYLIDGNAPGSPKMWHPGGPQDRSCWTLFIYHFAWRFWQLFICIIKITYWFVMYIFIYLFICSSMTPW